MPIFQKCWIVSGAVSQWRILYMHSMNVSLRVLFMKSITLKQQGKTPVCFFRTRLACHVFNTQMLNSFNMHYIGSHIQEMKCSDNIDESSSSRKWTKRADKKLEELSKDCNNTAGLKAHSH